MINQIYEQATKKNKYFLSIFGFYDFLVFYDFFGVLMYWFGRQIYFFKGIA